MQLLDALDRLDSAERRFQALSKQHTRASRQASA